MNTYFLSGLGADKRIFQKIQLPKGYEAVYLDWMAPLPEETLEAYSLRLAAHSITDEKFVLIGLSFGGMVAAEIASVKKPDKTILISSIATSDELPWYFAKAGQLGIQKIVPVNLLKAATFIHRVVGARSEEEKAIVYHYIKHADPEFIRWALNAILQWKRHNRVPGIIHLHGDEDHLLPLRFTHADYVIANGGHLMVLNKADEVNRILQKILLQN